MITVKAGNDLALRCPCGSYSFHDNWTDYEPSGTWRERRAGRVDAHCHGYCASCGEHVHAVIENTREGRHDPINL